MLKSASLFRKGQVNDLPTPCRFSDGTLWLRARESISLSVQETGEDACFTMPNDLAKPALDSSVPALTLTTDTECDFCELAPYDPKVSLLTFLEDGCRIAFVECASAVIQGAI